MMVTHKNAQFVKEYAKELLNIAKGDSETAESLIRSPHPARKENILYMIQQSTEKAIKSVLISKQISSHHVHDLGILIALLPEADYPPGGFDWTALNPYASIRQYEEGNLPLTLEEIEIAYRALLPVLDWARIHVAKALSL